jgi:hypothetical protein
MKQKQKKHVSAEEAGEAAEQELAQKLLPRELTLLQTPQAAEAAGIHLVASAVLRHCAVGVFEMKGLRFPLSIQQVRPALLLSYARQPPRQ